MVVSEFSFAGSTRRYATRATPTNARARTSCAFGTVLKWQYIHAISLYNETFSVHVHTKSTAELTPAPGITHAHEQAREHTAVRASCALFSLPSFVGAGRRLRSPFFHLLKRSLRTAREAAQDLRAIVAGALASAVGAVAHLPNDVVAEYLRAALTVRRPVVADGAPPIPHKDFSDLHEKMSGERASASDAHHLPWRLCCRASFRLRQHRRRISSPTLLSLTCATDVPCS